MERLVAIAMTAGAVILGVIGILRFVDSGPPPLGDISLASVTPPGQALEIQEQRFCRKDVPGYWASGTFSGTADEIIDWYDAGFGPRLAEPTARLNTHESQIGEMIVYEDIQVFVETKSVGRLFWVMTYETTSHHCPSDGTQVWDQQNAWTHRDGCGLVVEFWGVQYGRVNEEVPRETATIIELPEGRAIAHSPEQPKAIYVRDEHETDWFRHTTAGVCVGG